ncbi:hemerythrin domain-containing protein [Paenibacillus sp. FSL L8-0638]|uniref:hemerythrin domain-containing protein n=1 Tax=Paenibacillus TaxID=44249 RepID=UPI00315815EB
MSGPALRHVDSHSMIHEAALGEARELTELLDRSIKKGELDKAEEIAYITVEHWEGRTLQHAASEEEGLYVEAVGIKPELKNVIISLTRDHQLMREIVAEIKELLAQSKVGGELLARFQALIIVDELHNRDEMNMLEKEVEGLLHEK